jgi:hypothetical protein
VADRNPWTDPELVKLEDRLHAASMAYARAEEVEAQRELRLAQAQKAVFRARRAVTLARRREFTDKHANWIVLRAEVLKADKRLGEAQNAYSAMLADPTPSTLPAMRAMHAADEALRSATSKALSETA